MPIPGHSAGHGRWPQWPLAAAWAVSVAGLLAVALLPRIPDHRLSALDLGVPFGDQALRVDRLPLLAHRQPAFPLRPAVGDEVLTLLHHLRRAGQLVP